MARKECRDRTAESRIRFSVEARALPRGIEASSFLAVVAVVAVEEDLGFLDLEPEAVGAGFRFEFETAADVEASMATRCLEAAGGGGEVTKGEVWYEKKAGAQGEFPKARRIARQTKFPTCWKIYVGGPWCI